MTNCVAVTRPLTLQRERSEVTVIRVPVPGTTRARRRGALCVSHHGGGAVGFLTNGATLSNGVTHEETGGGGVWCESPGLCLELRATGEFCGFGGGAFWGTLVHCQLVGNTAGSGGGAVQAPE
jgi:hypothetical protein